MRKDKAKVIDEVWTDERVRSFLRVKSYDGEARDFHILLKAYQSMRHEDFAKFLGYFTEDGRDVNCPNRQGRTVLEIVKEHRKGTPYAEALQAAGAKVL